MPISTTTAKVRYDGDGSTTQFSIPFRFLQNAHIEVTHRNAGGAETTWTESTQYSLTGAGSDSGGTLAVLTSPTDYTPQSGEALTIRRVPSLTQEKQFPAGGSFPSAQVTEAFDLRAMVEQLLNEILARALVFPVTDPSSSTGDLPTSVTRASMFLGFDGDGKPIAAAGTVGQSQTPVTAFMETVLDDADAASARATLGAEAADADIVKQDQAAAFTKPVRSTPKVESTSAAGTHMLDMDARNNFELTLGHDITLDFSNIAKGQSGVVTLIQDSTGGRTVSYSANFEFENGSAPSNTLDANAKDVLAYTVDDNAKVIARLIENVS